MELLQDVGDEKMNLQTIWEEWGCDSTTADKSGFAPLLKRATRIQQGWTRKVKREGHERILIDLLLPSQCHLWIHSPQADTMPRGLLLVWGCQPGATRLPSPHYVRACSHLFRLHRTTVLPHEVMTTSSLGSPDFNPSIQAAERVFISSLSLET